MAREDFEGQGGGGGPFASYEFTVTAARFEVVPEYQDGNTLFLHWEGTSDADGWPVMSMDTYHPSFALGADWVTVDGGKTITYQGKSRKPKYGKRYGMMVSKVFEITEGITPDPLSRIDPKVAETWVGSKWLLERIDHDYGGSIGVHEIELPTEFLGWADDAASAAPSQPAAAAAAAAPTQPPAAAQASSNGDLRAQVVALAQLPSFEEFRTAALAIPGVPTDPALVQEILDQTNGIYATKA